MDDTPVTVSHLREVINEALTFMGERFEAVDQRFERIEAHLREIESTLRLHSLLLESHGRQLETLTKEATTRQERLRELAQRVDLLGEQVKVLMKEQGLQPTTAPPVTGRLTEQPGKLADLEEALFKQVDWLTQPVLRMRDRKAA